MATQTDAILQSLSARLAGLQPQSRDTAANSSRWKAAKPRTLATLFCLASKLLGEDELGLDAKQFQLYMTITRNELKALQQNWPGPFTFESFIQQGQGLYLRDAPNLGELVRSKPDFVFAEEVNHVHDSDDWLPLFILKAKIQILESLRILTRDPAHLPLATALSDFIVAAANSLRGLRAILPDDI